MGIIEMTSWTGEDLLTFYQTLYRTYGSQNWWPADSAFETIIGAIFAQNVSWKGAHQAVCAFIDADPLEPQKLYTAVQDVIVTKIRSSRYYNQKARKVMTFLEWFLGSCNGDISRMAAKPADQVREELLILSGFGHETVDSMLFYALGKPVFVVDAYTKRVGSRHGWFPETILYDQMQNKSWRWVGWSIK